MCVHVFFMCFDSSRHDATMVVHEDGHWAKVSSLIKSILLATRVVTVLLIPVHRRCLNSEEFSRARSLRFIIPDGGSNGLFEGCAFTIIVGKHQIKIGVYSRYLYCLEGAEERWYVISEAKLIAFNSIGVTNRFPCRKNRAFSSLSIKIIAWNSECFVCF